MCAAIIRPTIDETMLVIAETLALRSTCLKSAVGCVLTDSRGRIIGTGYNGVAHGQLHCNESKVVGDKYEPEKNGIRFCLSTKIIYPYACAGHDLPPGSETCQAIHAETNALLQCRNPDLIATVYSSSEPCFRCAKELLNTGATRIVYRKPYGPEPQAAALWRSAGRDWIQLDRK